MIENVTIICQDTVIKGCKLKPIEAIDCQDVDHIELTMVLTNENLKGTVDHGGMGKEEHMIDFLSNYLVPCEITNFNPLTKVVQFVFESHMAHVILAPKTRHKDLMIVECDAARFNLG